MDEADFVGLCEPVREMFVSVEERESEEVRGGQEILGRGLALVEGDADGETVSSVERGRGSDSVMGGGGACRYGLIVMSLIRFFK